MSKQQQPTTPAWTVEDACAAMQTYDRVPYADLVDAYGEEADKLFGELFWAAAYPEEYGS